MKAGDRGNKSPILTGILYPPKAKPHVKNETVLYHQPVLQSQTTVLPLQLCPKHPDTLAYCGYSFFLVPVQYIPDLSVTEDHKSICIFIF